MYYFIVIKIYFYRVAEFGIGNNEKDIQIYIR